VARKIRLAYHSPMSPVDSDGIRTRREKAGLSQRELARRASIYQPTLSRIESGKATRITVDMIEAIANALDCEPGDLLKATRKRAK
jgi:transcriptional regulator with XRE-family HTH domain